jgi:hypothetical protein
VADGRELGHLDLGPVVGCASFRIAGTISQPLDDLAPARRRRKRRP